MVRRRNSGLDFWFSTVDEVTFRASVSVRGDGFSRQDAKTETEATLCLDVRPSHSGGIVASLAAGPQRFRTECCTKLTDRGPFPEL